MVGTLLVSRTAGTGIDKRGAGTEIGRAATGGGGGGTGATLGGEASRCTGGAN